ncbi:MAG: ABC transporter permease [Bacteroidetes bacterium]|nr:ABC transporter permease [Bacteroidota bacterium]
MLFQKWILSLGRYMQLLGRTFRKPENFRMYYRAFMSDLELLGLNSLGIVSVISIFVGAVVTIQTAFNLDDPLVPDYYIAIATRESIILEFSPTIISLILAGKVGSNIASTLGSMRVSEQIDALEVMGVNPASYLIAPKILALVFFNPILIMLSMFLGMIGGYLASLGGVMSVEDFAYGLTVDFNAYHVSYAIMKTFVFAFLIVSISGYFGFYVKGGAIEVGVNATKAVVSSSVAIIVSNYILTQLLLV